MSQTPTSISRLLERHGLSPKKRLGQHFLADGNLIDKMIRTARVSQGDKVLEVGAGTGALTVALADAGAEVLAYEVDRTLEPALMETIGTRSKVEVRFEDAVDALPGALDAGPWKVVANLPYHIGTPLLMKLLRQAPQITEFTVMVQREVAERIVAVPGTRQYGLPSIVAGLICDVHKAFAVPPQVFIPPPAVSSAVVVLTRRTRVDNRTEGAIDTAATVFRHRRKMLRSTFDPRVLAAAGIRPEARPEDLAPERFAELWEAARG
jgi:16S rRNA (adenine1518-N6/adenine1519-N6)-dimethyltransferase